MADDETSTVRLLVGDIGGTNARLVLYEADSALDFSDVATLKKHHIVAQRNYKNDDFKSFSDVLCAFLALDGASGIKIDSCCFAVAGPVINNRINFTNRDGWIIDRATIETDFEIGRVQLVNDFVASGHGLLSLSNDELITLQPGKPRRDGPIALVGAGTGLGECYLTRSAKDSYSSVFASEGGHVEFAPRSSIEDELLKYLQGKFSKTLGATGMNGDISKPGITEALTKEQTRVSVERVLSGKGLENIYEFLRHEYPDQINKNYDEQYNDEIHERGRLIGKQQYNYPLFRQSLEIMFGIYGSEVGNVGLKYLPYGGLYIAGGIAPKNVNFMTDQNSLFMKRLRQKGRLSSIMRDFPVYVVMKEDLGLRGAHIVASRLIDESPKRSSSHLHFGNNNMDRSPSATALSPRASFISAPKPDSFRYAVSDYPVTYACITGATAVATASFMAIGAIVFSRVATKQ